MELQVLYHGCKSKHLAFNCLRFCVSCICLCAAAPRGFNPVQDLNDNYQFLYPFGWQEVTVSGVDVVYKDVVEPLESVSVTITPTDKKDVTEFGDIADVSVPTTQ
jgi:photosystem II oxygen-evolving enhancer protein 2